MRLKAVNPEPFDRWFATLPCKTQQKLAEAVEVAEGLEHHGRLALRYWSLWQSLDHRLQLGEHLQKALQVRPPTGLAELVDAVKEAVVIASMRLADNPDKASDRNSGNACTLACMLNDGDVAGALSSNEWQHYSRSQLEEAELHAERQRNRITWFLDRVPARWDDNSANTLKCAALNNARCNLRAFRNKYIGHIDLSLSQYPSIEQVHVAVEESISVARCADRLFLGRGVGPTWDIEYNAHDVGEVWDVLAAGMENEHNDHQ